MGKGGAPVWRKSTRTQPCIRRESRNVRAADDENKIEGSRTEKDRPDEQWKAEDGDQDAGSSSCALLAAVCSACKCCKACTRTSPRWRAEMPSAAARAAESVVIAVMRAVTAARRIAFSSKYGSGPCGVFTINWIRSA